MRARARVVLLPRAPHAFALAAATGADALRSRLDRRADVARLSSADDDCAVRGCNGLPVLASCSNRGWRERLRSRAWLELERNPA